MDYFHYQESRAYAESVPLSQIAEEVGTPTYVYSKKTIERHCDAFLSAFQDIAFLPCYAVKANSHLSILKILGKRGFGADVVSLGEILRAIKAGIAPDKIVFSGVGKTVHEIREALELGLHSFHVESYSELEAILAIAEKTGKQARVSLRINPQVDAKTLPYITTGLYENKFGIAEEKIGPALDLIRRSHGNLQLVGISCHIGSQITEIKPFEEAVARMRNWADQMIGLGHPLEYLDMGGGLGIKYDDERPPDLTEYAEVLKKGLKGTHLKLLLEPGRVIVGNTGVLLTEVLYFKKTPAKEFVIVDAAMNDLLRPSLYRAFHDIKPVDPPGHTNKIKADVVGPICETGDFLGKERDFIGLKEGQRLMVRGCGAYGASMVSNYNSRPRPAEVLVDGDCFHVITPRETYEQMWSREVCV